MTGKSSRLALLGLDDTKQTSLPGNARGRRRARAFTTGSAASMPSTLHSTLQPFIHPQDSDRTQFEALLSEAVTSCAKATICSAVGLICDCARGGALVVVARASSFQQVFEHDDRMFKPVICSCDEGYMTDLLRNCHVTDPRFAEVFRDFTEHSASDRWPSDHPNPAARGQPKDGAILIDVSGYRTKCAAKILGLPPTEGWKGVGTRHATALACACYIDGAVVLVRSESSIIHGLFRHAGSVHAYRLL